MHCFSIDLQSNHPDTLCVQTQNAARTRRNLPSLHTYSDEHKCNFLKSAFLHTLYSKHIIRKLIEKMHSHHNMKKRKFLILLWNENEMKTNNLEYCVQESKRTLRGLLQAKADCQARQNVKRNKNKLRSGGGGVEVVEHAETYPTALETSLRKWQRYCVLMRLFSFVCVKRWRYIFALFFNRLAIQSS